MSSITLNPGAFAVVSMRILQSFRGVWIADLELSPEILALAPSSGKVTISIASSDAVGAPLATLVGTIDPRGTGPFVETYRVRVLGGGAGWDQIITPQHYHSDGGLFAQDVLSAIATQVGETVVTPVPIGLGIDFFTTSGPASRAFDAPGLVGYDWWVDPTTGVTNVGIRPPAIADSTLELMTWSAADQVAELVCQNLIMPGTSISDARLPAGPVVVRDVEQVFDAQGSRAKAWCGTSPVSQFMNDFRSAVIEYSGRRYLSTYEYRLIEQNVADGRLVLQPVGASDGVPTTLPVTPWWGAPGISAKLKPSSFVRLAFLRGDPSQPIVDAYAPGLGLELTLDATTAVHVGPSAAAVDLAGGEGGPVALASPTTAFLDALKTWSEAVAGALSSAGFPIVAPQAALGTAIATAKTAIPAEKVTGT